MSFRMPILHIGFIPPPVGGLSIHIERLHKRLLAEGLHSLIWDYSEEIKDNPLVRNIHWHSLPFHLLGRIRKPTLYHVHGSNSVTLLMVCLALFISPRSRLIWALHNSRFDKELSSRLFLIRPLLHILSTRAIIVVDNLDNINKIRNMGIKNETLCIPEHISLPCSEINAHLPDDLEEFLKLHKTILAATITAPIFYEGVDLYGIDLLLSLGERLKKENVNFGLVVTVLRPDFGDRSYFRRIKNEIENQGLNPHFKIIEKPLPSLLPLLNRAQIVLRPTYSDGNSMLVNEALSLGKKVVASDCAPRPDGCVLFRNRDFEDFNCAVLDCMKGKSSNLSNIPKDNFPEFLKLYKSVLLER